MYKRQIYDGALQSRARMLERFAVELVDEGLARGNALDTLAALELLSMFVTRLDRPLPSIAQLIDWIDALAPLLTDLDPSYARLVKQGWTDGLRALYPDERIYTFWHYMRNRWQRNAGLRLDHVLLSPLLAERLQDAGVDRDVRGKKDASDHAPVWVRLRR